MTPTLNLRFVERSEPVMINADGGVITAESIRVLQQWFEYGIVVGGMNTGEWIDVPLEVEE